MRKKTILHFVDTVFWWTVYALPVIVLLIASNNSFVDALGSGSFLRNFFYITQNNPVFTAIVGLFGQDGVLPFFSSGSYIFTILTWFVAANLCHIAVDILLFIPRMAHKLIDVLTSRGADNG